MVVTGPDPRCGVRPRDKRAGRMAVGNPWRSVRSGLLSSIQHGGHGGPRRTTERSAPAREREPSHELQKSRCWPGWTHQPPTSGKPLRGSPWPSACSVLNAYSRANRSDYPVMRREIDACPHHADACLRRLQRLRPARCEPSDTKRSCCCRMMPSGNGLRTREFLPPPGPPMAGEPEMAHTPGHQQCRGGETCDFRARWRC